MNITKFLTLLLSIIMLLVGLSISNTVNNTSINAKEENEKMVPLGLWLIIPSVIILVMIIGGLGAATVYIPEAQMMIMKFKYYIAAIVALLIMFITFGSIIMSYKNNTDLDDENKNDKYSTLGQWISSIGLLFTVVVFLIKL